MKRINLFIQALLAVIIFIMVISVLSININSIKLQNLMLVFFASIVLGFIAVKVNRCSHKIFIIMLILISAAAYTAWNLYALTVPVSDYKVIFQGASKIINGTFSGESFNKTSYFYFYNYQIGYTAYIALIMKIFGQNILYFKILEGLYMILTSIMVYKIVNKISTRDAAALAALYYALYIPNIMGSSIINNQHISTLMLCICLYFIVKDKKSYDAALGGIMLGFTQVFRPIAIIIIIAVFMVYAYNMIKNKKYTSYFKKFAVFIIAYMIVVKSFDAALVNLNISPGPISKSNAKYFKFVLGLKGGGLYNIPDKNAEKTKVYFDLKTLNFNYDKYNEECIKFIKASLKDYKNTLLYIKNKMTIFMGSSDNQYYFALSQDKINNNIYYLVHLGNVQYMFLLVCALIALLIKLKNPKDNIDIFSILIIGFVLVHIFIEVQPRYRYEIYVFLAVLTSQFLEKVMF